MKKESRSIKEHGYPSKELLSKYFYLDEENNLRYNVDTKYKKKGDLAGFMDNKRNHKKVLIPNYKNKEFLVHKIVYILKNGDIPKNIRLMRRDTQDGYTLNNLYLGKIRKIKNSQGRPWNS